MNFESGRSPGRDDAALVQPAGEVDHNLASTVVINHLRNTKNYNTEAGVTLSSLSNSKIIPINFLPQTRQCSRASSSR